MFRKTTQPGVGDYLVPGLPFASSAFARVDPRPAPQLGQHTAQVLAEVLGLTDAAIGALIDKRLVLCAAEDSNAR